MKILAWGRTDTGQKREHNEDALLILERPRLLAVADGMGGHVGGARASKMAVDVLREEFSRTTLLDFSPDEQPEPTPVLLLREATRAASRAIYDAAQGDTTLRGMGTTLTALLFLQDWGVLSHVGDSRAYLWRDGQLQQLSQDHSWVQEQHRAGWMTFDEARTSRFRHVITRSVGYERDVQADVHHFPVRVHDCFLLCSDGLSSFVADDELKAVLAAQPISEIPDRLIALANEKGGDDNITVIVAQACP